MMWLQYGDVIESYFFPNEERRDVTFNGDHYRTMLIDFLWPELQNIDIEEMWFQSSINHINTKSISLASTRWCQFHTVDATFDMLKDKFSYWIILGWEFVNWMSQTCDTKTLEDYIKAQVYTDNSRSLAHLEIKIHRTIAGIQQHSRTRWSKIEVIGCVSVSKTMINI